jgi:hypothetical protein
VVFDSNGLFCDRDPILSHVGGSVPTGARAEQLS